jgi:hypothetical protein
VHPHDQHALQDILQDGRDNSAVWDLVASQVHRSARLRRGLNGDGTPSQDDVEALLSDWRKRYP